MSFFEAVLSNPFIIAEVGTILTVIGIQIYFFVEAKKEATILKSIFDHPLTLLEDDEDDESEFRMITSDSLNEINIRIRNSINNYLINNRGASINYSIIKDIIDREVDAKDEEVNQSIPIPLYLGLAATIIGIIFGLFAMPSLAENATGGGSDLAGIDLLINGVKVAMFASLSGLVWTIILTSFIYNRASKKILQDKNKQLNYLQENLLPEIIKNEDVGVVGLKNSINKFSRQANSIIENINSAVKHSESNIIAQQDTLDRIEKLNITKVSKVNLELFDKLDKSVGALENFTQFISELSVISDKLYEFSNNTQDVQEIASSIKVNLHESKELTSFLTKHLNKMEEMGDVAMYSFDLSEKKFKDAVDNLIDSTSKNVESVKSASDNFEASIGKTFNELSVQLEKVSTEYIDRLTETYSVNQPEFDNLKHLKELESIKAQISQALNSNGTGESPISVMSVVEKLNDVTKLLESVEKNTKSIKAVTKASTLKMPKWLKDIMNK